MDLKIYLQWILQQTPPSKRKTLNELKIVLFLSSLINYFQVFALKFPFFQNVAETSKFFILWTEF